MRGEGDQGQGCRAHELNEHLSPSPQGQRWQHQFLRWGFPPTKAPGDPHSRPCRGAADGKGLEHSQAPVTDRHRSHRGQRPPRLQNERENPQRLGSWTVRTDEAAQTRLSSSPLRTSSTNHSYRKHPGAHESGAPALQKHLQFLCPPPRPRGRALGGGRISCRGSDSVTPGRWARKSRQRSQAQPV